MAGAPNGRHIVLITMKSQLRGRIRREVTTLLGEGARVTVIGLASDADFLQQLSHSSLQVHLIKPTSVLTRAVGSTRSTLMRMAPKKAQGHSGSVAADATDVAPRRPPFHGRLLRVFRRLVRYVIVKVMARVRRATMRVVRFAFAPWHRITLYRDFARKACALALGLKPEAVQSCDLEGLVAAVKVARRLDLPHLHDCHELFLERIQFSMLERLVLSRVERRAMRAANVVTVVNGSIGEELRRRYSVSAVVLRNCADVPRQVVLNDVRKLAGLRAGCDIVLYQGGLLQGRGLIEVVDAAAYLPEDIAIVFLGYGAMRGELEERAREQGCAQRVRFVDAVPPDELLSITASATLGVVPYQPVSMNNKLALPNKIFEYLAVGVPVVVSDIPELRRIVETGCGRTYDSFDPRSLAASITVLLQPHVFSTARAAAVRYGRENSWEVERAILTGVYERILGGRQQA